MVGKQSGEIDPLLEPLLLTTRDEEVDLFLSQLIATHAEPVITGIIRHKLHLYSHGGIEQADADDIHQDVVAQLLAALQRLRQQPAAHPIGDLRGFTAVIAHRACSRWMRRRFPERHALKNRLSYFFTRHRAFALWQGANTNENVIWFNYIDVVCRGVYTFSLKAPKTLTLRLSNGSNKQTFWLTLLLYLNEIDTFSRKTGMFSVRKDADLIFRIYNRHNQVNYKLTIQPGEP